MKGKKRKTRSKVINTLVSFALCITMTAGAAVSVAADSSTNDTSDASYSEEYDDVTGDITLSADTSESTDASSVDSDVDQNTADDKGHDELQDDDKYAAEEKTLPQWYEDGKKTGKFEISSPEEMTELAELVNDGITTFSGRTVTLTADIDMSKREQDDSKDAEDDAAAAQTSDGEESGNTGDDVCISYAWEPAGSGSSEFFAGTFDGAGHTISGIKYEADGTTDKYAGVFGHLLGTVKNLTITSCEFLGDAQYAGAVCGYAGTGAVISDCIITETSVSSESTAESVYAGGAAGYFDGERAAHIINRSAVTAGTEDKSGCENAYAGGIAGFTGNDAVVINCGNSGAINANASVNAYAGGLTAAMNASEIKNCWNKASVNAAAPNTGRAAAGGLAGTADAGSFYNSYNDNKNISGGISYTGYIVGYLTGSKAASADYVYWPGKGTYDSSLTYGSGGMTLAAETTCRGIEKIVSSSSLVKRLNNQIVASCDGDNPTTELYMWKLVDESSPKSSPEFREESPSPIFPNKPVMSPQSTAVGVSPDVNDAEHTVDLNVSVSNSDADVVMSYQWLTSDDGESYSIVTASDGNNGKSTSYKVTGTETGVRYYKLRVICSDDKADASMLYYSDVITVTTGWRIKLEAGGMYDGSSAVKEITDVNDVFPVLPDSGAASLPKPASEGNFFMGYAASYSQGQSYKAAELMSEFDTTGMSGNVTLWSVFRPAEKISLTIAKGADSAAVKEGITDDMLSTILDEGTDYTVPDGNTFFENSGYRFMGWHVSEDNDDKQNSDSEDGSKDDENAAVGGSGDGAGDDAADGPGSVSQDADDSLILKSGDIYVPGRNDITLTAVWHKMYSVSYASGSTSVKGELPEGTEAVYIEGESFEMPSGDGLSRNGYVFDGWKDNITYGNYKAGETYTLPADISKLKDIVFTAQWRKLIQIEIKATENSNQKIQEPYNNVMYIPSGNRFQLPEQGDMKLTGFRFMGWRNIDGDLVKPGAYCIAQIDDTYSGVWMKIYTISFSQGIISGDDTAEITGDSPASIDVVINENILLPESTYTVTTSKEGVKYYRFMGWRLASDSEAPVVGGGADYEMIYTHDITLEAQWRAMTEDMTWDGSNTDKPAEGEGTQSNPYRITKPDELAWMSEYLNKEKNQLKGVYFSLENDIDLFGWDWKPIGWSVVKNNTSSETYSKNTVFNGIFNGNGHTIYGMSTDVSVSGENAEVGLFGAMGSEAKIYDLNISGADVKISDIGSLKKNCGILVGDCDGGEITGCTVDGTLTYTEASSSIMTSNEPNLGGIAGKAENASISNCENNAHIIGNITMTIGAPVEHTGGIVGTASSTEVKNCSNTGTLEWKYSDISASANVLSYIGGIAGYMDGSSKLSGCENSGSLIPRNNVAVAGGIVGYITGDVVECENSGDVSHESDSSVGIYSSVRGIAGIVGINIGNVKNCINRGDITSTMAAVHGDHIDEVRVGGITGEEKGNISNCLNTGNVIYTYTTVLDEYTTTSKRIKISAGGIAGVIGYGNIQNCFSAAEKVEIVFSSGVDARTYSQVTCHDMAAGGILGHTAVSNTDHSECTVNNFMSFYGENCSASDSEIINSYWVHSDGGAKYINVPADGDGSQIKTNSESLASMTPEEAASGKAAYLLDGGAKKHNNEWTQGSAGLPELGTPSYYKAESATEGVELSYGNDVLGKAVYVPQDGKVKVVYDSLAKEITIGDPYIKNTVTNGTTTTYDYWQKYYETADVKVSYADGTSGEISDDGSNNKTFTMKASDASVSAYFETDITKVNASQIKERHDHYETVTEEEKKPEPDKGSGGGSHGGRGPDNKTTPGTPEGTEISGPGVPEGTGINTNGTNTSISTSISADGNSQMQLMLPAAKAGSNDSEMQPEETEARQTESGGDNVTEPEIKEPEPEPEEENEQQDVFEVVQKAVKSDPLPSIILLILIIAILIAAGYRRYRKNRK